MDIVLSDSQKMVLDCFLNTDKNMFITGNAGTGKTLLLHEIVSRSQGSAIVAAPTGVAAMNAGGVTIHSLLKIPFTPYKPMFMRGISLSMLPKYSLRPHEIEVIKNMETMIIDEISMVRADLLDAVNDALCYYRESKEPFGGCRMVFIGDLMQLPPVVIKEEWGLISGYYDSPYFFDAKIMKYANFEEFRLTEVFRQKDEDWINILNKIRYGKVDSEVKTTLGQMYNPLYDIDKNECVVLTATNAEANRINNTKLKKIKKEEHVFKARVKGKFNMKDVICDETLKLKEGAQVMMLVNDTQMGRYVNGSIGTFVGVSESGGVEYLVVDIDGSEVPIERFKWEKKSYKAESTGGIKSESVGSCRQFPVKLAWAITIHKSQGLTFDKVAISAGRAFASGQVYVALSRGRTRENTVLIDRINSWNIKTDTVLLNRKKLGE